MGYWVVCAGTSVGTLVPALHFLTPMPVSIYPVVLTDA